ncbi:30S ribosomal protein S8e [Candidatus Woesearchaeota archaeon]|jgi:small subunit ribosomal protein S8e|nr:30S ribosomal protein S8e [Candidatus Woesearchaeota archaeon]MBT4110667.1 30S ribosomal protein S8e [Candidatus Woesearchaeota archaeon]MBT4336263.1 30S ribosomal protein S8e [Candidatus Woesearchaeota archaeon]MBT4469376.1 30S ribosomal protein S8e [Candidatus Woesearchaeota archaeon]MBT6743801.1 30S ribosomal protein S8e [Candidatus Woesearchaeota archaeon]
MARSQAKSKRKLSGGRYKSTQAKKKYELAGYQTNTRLGDLKTKLKRILGGNKKRSTLSTNQISVTDKKGKTTKTEILNVVENPANPNLVRRNVITKGAIVETKLGKVRITSRPGQEGSVCGVLV